MHSVRMPLLDAASSNSLGGPGRGGWGHCSLKRRHTKMLWCHNMRVF